MEACTLIAEIGCNHKGDLKIAKEFVDVATSFCKVTHLKFQKRNVRELLTEEQYRQPHPVPYNAFGPTYGEHREALEFDIEQHRELKEYCEARDAVCGCSFCDLTSVIEIESLRPASIKVPAAMNTHTELLHQLCGDFDGIIHVSLGMTTRREEEALIELFRARHRLGDVVLYACTSGYPIQAEEACLYEIRRLQDTYGSAVKAVGYSGHHNGISLDLGAFMLGASYIERHFTLNRTWKGTDHAASLEPDGLRHLNRYLQTVVKALTYKPCEILPIEEEQRAKLKWTPRA